MAKSKVYFTKNISPEMVVKMYDVLGKQLPGKVAVKVHSGEAGNKNFLRPDYMKPIVDRVHGTVVECNTAYGGARCTTAKHKKLLNDHKWDSYFDVDIMDAEGPDTRIDIKDGLILDYNLVGKNMDNYDSMLVVSHFKGHAMGGFGGALKQLSIGCGSTAGKCIQHSAGRSLDPDTAWQEGTIATTEEFKKAMADAAATVVRKFNGNIAYINNMVNLSVDCDCDGNAAPPCMKDIGILSSTDPVALDKACYDLIANSKDPGKYELLERIHTRMGELTIYWAEKLGIGSTDYELIEIDK